MRKNLIPVVYGLEITDTFIYRKVINVLSVPTIGSTLVLGTVFHFKVTQVQQNLDAYLGAGDDHFEMVIAKLDDLLDDQRRAAMQWLSRNGWKKIMRN